MEQSQTISVPLEGLAQADFTINAFMANDVDLTVTSVNALTYARPGDYIAVSWTVENQGTVDSGPFYNRISLATTPYGTDISLGNFSMGSIAAGSSLLYCNSWWKAGNLSHGRLLHLFEELAGIGTE